MHMSNRMSIILKDAVGRNPLIRLKAPVDLSVGPQEHIAIIGPNGAGKTNLVAMLTGKNPLSQGELTYDFGPDVPATAYGNVIEVTFEDNIGSVENPYYFQQRFNSQDRDESPYLRSLLPPGCLDSPLIDTFMMRPLLDKRIVLLSSGEMRRYHLFRYLIRNPRVLIVDNPYIGLDAPMREQLEQFFRQLVAMGNVTLVLVLSMLDRVPECVTHVVRVEGGCVMPKMTRSEYLSWWDAHGSKTFLNESLRSAIMKLPVKPVATLTGDGRESDEIISIRNLSLRLFEGKTLYNGLDWTVRRGEHWALQGRNGAGKSTLLSLICADHPAAYACDISLFGRRRGTGESIWEIKKHIGFVSPEFHRAYRQNRPAIDIVASGLHDSVGLYIRPSLEDREKCRFWMQVFGIAQLADRTFLSLSSGEQRLCLLARAFVKDPALLILDEPLHGLDTYRRDMVRDIIQTFCMRPDKTLIMVSHYADEFPRIIDHSLTL